MMAMAEYSFRGLPDVIQPTTLAEAWQAKRRLGAAAAYISGGTLLRTQWENGVKPVPHLMVSLESIKELMGIEFVESTNQLRIGSLMTLSSCRKDSKLREHAPMLVEACRNIAAPSIRNLATIGGNVSGLTGDALPALLAMDGEVGIYRDGAMSFEPIRQWLHRSGGAKASDDIVCSVQLPVASPSIHVTPSGWRSWTYYKKVGRREAFTPSLVTVAMAGIISTSGEMAHVRVAMGGGAAVPIRLGEVEHLLQAHRLNTALLPHVIEAVMKDASVASDAFASDRYRKEVAANLIAAQLWTLGKTSGSRRSS